MALVDSSGRLNTKKVCHKSKCLSLIDVTTNKSSKILLIARQGKQWQSQIIAMATVLELNA